VWVAAREHSNPLSLFSLATHPHPHPLPPNHPQNRRPNLVGALASAGILLFSGSCYACALREDRSLGKAAPYGGFALMGAWLAFAL
jgi:hypothetical protein